MKIKYIFLLIIGNLLISSCESILDKRPLDKYDEQTVWSSPELIQAFIYGSLQKTTDYLIQSDQWSDNSTIQEDGTASSINKEQIDRYYNAGWNCYKEIRPLNLVLEKVKASTTLMENDKKYFTAQAKMMRGMIYFSQARKFGKLMIIDRVLSPDEDMQFPRTSTIKETYDFIIKDLKEAAVDLPTDAANQQGILTKGAAYALIAEVALHGAAYIESGQAEYYEIARQASEDLFALGIYELDTNFKNIFNDFNTAMNSKEIILAQWRHENNTTFVNTIMQSMGPCTNNDKNIADATPKLADDFLAWPTMFPSVDLVNAYEVIDRDGTSKKWDETSYYRDYTSRGGYVSNAIYKNRDQRFYASIAYDSCQYFNSTVTMREKGNLHWNSNVFGDWGMTKTGYFYRKGLYEKKRIYHSDPTYYHNVILRLGRSYLNYAEVMLRQNNISKAIEYINKTRTTHGGLPALSNSLSITEAWQAYKNERRVELVMENDRYWSLLRWGKADNQETIPELNITHQAISISSNGRAFQFIDLPFKRADNIRSFTKKRYLFPVPQSEKDLNPKLDQNPGW